MNPIKNPTDMLRQYAATNSIIQKKEVKTALNFSQTEINRCFDTLRQSGELIRVGRGIYKFVATVETQSFEVTDKIWRAMKVKRVFSCSDIAMLAETTIAYVYKLFRKYRADGFIKQQGVRATHGSGEEKIWRLTLRGQNKARKPNVEQFKPDPLVMDAVNLNRLVCSGLVRRDEDSARHAIALCKMLISGIKEDLKK